MIGEKIWKCDEKQLGELLRQTNVDVHDMAIIFYSKLARWNEDKLFNLLLRNPPFEAFKKWIQFVKPEVAKMYADMDAEDKQGVAEIVDQLIKLRDDT